MRRKVGALLSLLFETRRDTKQNAEAQAEA